MSLKGAAFVLLIASIAFSQDRPATVVVHVTADSAPVKDAIVTVNGTVVATDVQGIAHAGASVGKVQVSVKKEGFLPATTSLAIDDREREWQVQFELQKLVDTYVSCMLHPCTFPEAVYV